MESLDTLAKRLKDTQEFCSAIGDHLDKNFIIEGKTMRQWKKKFFIKIPEEINFPILITLAQEIMVKYQEAAFYRDSQQVSLAIMEQTKSEKYNTAFHVARTSHQEEFGKNLSAESCRIAATLAVRDLEAAIGNQKVVHTFWVKTCDTLTELRKLTELIGYALSSDARVQKDFVIRGTNGQ